VILRPFGIFRDGQFETGLEVVLESGIIEDIRPHTGLPEPFILSAPFVNAHSHLEYFGLQGQIQERDYWPWIREITRLKLGQTPQDVVADCLGAARENVCSGIGWIGEHSDRQGSAEAIESAGLRGTVYFEIITFFERDNPCPKLDALLARLSGPRPNGVQFGVAPHAPHTVDEATLRRVSTFDVPISIHVAESADETRHFQEGEGAVSEFFRSHGYPVEPQGCSSVEYLRRLGLCREGAQFVHCCDVGDSDIEIMARSRVAVAHCPRTNRNLGCRIAPVRRMIESGLEVGVGLDSAASSGPIDMFAEMRCALESAELLGEPLSSESVWSMATDRGARTLGIENWTLRTGWSGPMIRINADFTGSLSDVLGQASPKDVTWINGSLQADS
jgi:5-methylthioadenosine/S-adenosylhomocysteine deaminase